MEPRPNQPTVNPSGPGGQPRFRLEASGSLERLLVVLHVGAGACLWHAEVPWGLASVGCGLIAAHLVASVRVHARRSASRAVLELVRTDRAGWRAVTRTGAAVAGEVLPGTLVHPRLVLLGLGAVDGTRLRVVVPPDALDEEQYRRLRVALREAVDSPR